MGCMHNIKVYNSSDKDGGERNKSQVGYINPSNSAHSIAGIYTTTQNICAFWLPQRFHVICPKVHLSEGSPVRRFICPKVHLSEGSSVRRFICPKVHLSDLWNTYQEYLAVPLPSGAHNLHTLRALHTFIFSYKVPDIIGYHRLDSENAYKCAQRFISKSLLDNFAGKSEEHTTRCSSNKVFLLIVFHKSPSSCMSSRNTLFNNFLILTNACEILFLFLFGDI